jgi:hypothetical protein
MAKLKDRDFYLGVKAIGYAWAFLPHDGSSSRRAFLDHCKFYLCQRNRILMKDPIWDSYTEEEIFIEFYAHLYCAEEKQKRAFETSLRGLEDTPDSFADWASDMENKNKAEIEAKAEQLEDSFSFSPKDLQRGN